MKYYRISKNKGNMNIIILVMFLIILMQLAIIFYLDVTDPMKDIIPLEAKKEQLSQQAYKMSKAGLKILRGSLKNRLPRGNLWVVVATKPLKKGTQIRKEHIEKIAYTQTKVKVGATNSVYHLLGRELNEDVKPGEQVTAEMLVKRDLK